MNRGFLPGDELVEATGETALYVVERSLPRIQCIEVIDLESKSERMLELGPLRQRIANGEIRVLRQGVDWNAGLDRHSAEDDAALQGAMRLIEKLKYIRKTQGVSFNKAYAILSEQDDAQRGLDGLKLLSRAQANRLNKRDRQGIPLRLSDARKGNRSPRYSEAVVNVIKEIAIRHFLQHHSRWTLRTVTEIINQDLADAGHPTGGKKVSQTFVSRIIKGVRADPDHARMLPQDAIAAKSVARHRIRIAGLLERVEQDGVHMPFLVSTPHGISSDVWLIHAIDCGTSFPVGWYLGIGSSRVTSTLACIESILFPKARALDRLGLNYNFDVYGTPSKIVYDNGPETKGDRILRLTALGIDPHHLKSRHPQDKPFIERLNRSLKTYLETLPGCTRFNGKDGQRDPLARGDVLMTMEELERWIVRFYFEHWVNHKLERLIESVFTDNEDLGSTPQERQKTLTEIKGFPVPLPPSLDDWRSVLYETQYRTLSRKTGITYGRYHFRGEKLSYLIDRYGEVEVKVLIDVDDFRVVYVVEQDSRDLVILTNASTSESTPAYSYVEADAIFKEAAFGNEAPASEALRRDILNRSAGTVTPVTQPGKRTKASKVPLGTSRDTSQRARRHQAVVRAQENPLPAVRPTLGHPPLGTAEDDWSNAPALDVRDRKTGETRL